MKWIAITGGIATGKSTVSQILVEKGYPVVDADVLARDVVAVGTEGYKQIVNSFGSEILNTNKILDRKKLGAIVFADAKKLEILESILHPLIQKRAQELRLELERAGHHVAFYDIPLLFEKKLENKFDAVVLVYSPRNLQLERLLRRSSLAEDEAQMRLNSQIDIEQKRKMAHFVIDNSKDFVQLKNEVNKLLQNSTFHLGVA